MIRNYFILHGHFYQPPRENPWTGFVDRQESANPYNDWNSRINTECYSSCTRTPILDNGEVMMVMNCYEYLSFNFGPTLFEWMSRKDADPSTIEKIVEGDKISVFRNSGHGNAIAQVYNHMIMPLASVKDQYTQILWGLQDFKMRFKRDSEGIWLGETAINNETAEILVDCGIKFVILSPFQAKKVIRDSSNIDVLGGKIDSSKPYKLNTKKGPLSIFFYDGALASGVSFGELLTGADKLYNAVINSFNNQKQDVKLVHTATDGEVYGHHKPYGNMALARMIYNVTRNSDPKFTFTNYGKFLEDFPPSEECELHLGDDGLGSSWSCAHGVGRWMRDCGCNTGGQKNWNQKWRAPLREAFDLLRDNLHQMAEYHTKDLLKDVWDARNDYFSLMLLNTNDEYEKFFHAHQKRVLTDQERIFITKIMESLRYAMLMYTSCGWFFSDISGIETVQDILYSVRSYEFSKEILDSQLNIKYRKILDRAKSNVVSQGTGSNILDFNVQKYQLSFDMIREYVCWLIVSQGIESAVQCVHEFIFTLVWCDNEKLQYVLHFTNHIGLDIVTAFYLNSSDDKVCYLSYKDVVISNDNIFDNEEFWIEDSTWNKSYLSSMHLFLRIQFVSRSIQFEMERGYHHSRAQDSLALDAIWGAESLLLPYEKRILVFHYASNIYQFAKEIAYQTSKLDGIDTFIRESELLKKSSVSHEESELYLEPIARALEVYLRRILPHRDSAMLKDARMIFWSLKDSISMTNMDILRDIVYTFHKVNINSIDDTIFIMELNSIMQDMIFSKHFI